jgi:hypothetical protein
VSAERASIVLRSVPRLYGIGFPVSGIVKLARDSRLPQLKALGLEWYHASGEYAGPASVIDYDIRIMDYDAKIAEIRSQKEKGIDEQDFELAASRRDDEKRLLNLKALASLLELDCPAEMPELWQLVLKGFPFRDLVQFTVPSSIRSVVLEAWPSIAGLNGIATCSNLEEIEIRRCSQTSTIDLSALAGLKHLKSIYLDLGPMCSPDLLPLASVPSLREVTINSCASIDLRTLTMSGKRRKESLTVHLRRDQLVSGAEDTSCGILVSFDVEPGHDNA